MASFKSVKAQLVKANKLLQYQNLGISNQPNLKQLSNASNVKGALTILIDLGLFKNNVDPLKGTEIFSNNAEHLVSLAEKINAYVAHLDIVKSQLAELINAFDIFEPTEDVNSVNVTLPDTINDFTKLSKVASEINFAISQPLAISDFNCEANIKSVENGTVTINVGFNCAEAAGVVTFICGLIGAALKFRKTKLEGDLLIENIREKKKKNNSITVDAIEQVNKEEQKELLEVEAQKMLTEYYKNKIEEHQQQLGNLVHSIETLSNLFSEGIIITPSINADKETRKQFPSVSEIQLLENKVKQLKSGNEQQN